GGADPDSASGRRVLGNEGGWRSSRPALKRRGEDARESPHGVRVHGVAAGVEVGLFRADPQADPPVHSRGGLVQPPLLPYQDGGRAGPHKLLREIRTGGHQPREHLSAALPVEEIPAPAPPGAHCPLSFPSSIIRGVSSASSRHATSSWRRWSSSSE